MKRIIQFGILSLMVTFILGSCVEGFKVGDNFLEKAPGVDITGDTIFGKADYARRFLWQCYRGLYTGLPYKMGLPTGGVDRKMNMGAFEALSDCWHSHMGWDETSRTYYAGAYDASVENWSSNTRFGYNQQNCWETIRACWIFIERIDDVPDMDTQEKKRLKAEAKVILSSRYFDMFRHFGGLPIVDHSWDVEEPVQNPRGTVIETHDFMIRLLDEAEKDLPWVLDANEVSVWDGRLTRAAALGLKCKILLFTASPLFNDDVPYCTESPQDAVTNRNVWTGGYDETLWDDCLEACEYFFGEVAKYGHYDLVRNNADYRTAFRTAYLTRGSGWDNPEMLISTRKTYNDWGGFRSRCSKEGAFTPSQEYVEMFPMADGSPFVWGNEECMKKMFTYRDPRLYETVLVNGADYQGRKAELWVGGREMQQNSIAESGQFGSGYDNFKYILDFQKSNGIPYVWPYLRMAEVYLIYAEALLKAGRLDDAIDQVDIIRARVGLKGLKECNPDLNLGDEKILLNEILRERACELGLEDVRFFDMIRHKMADRFTMPLHGLITRRADGKEESWSDKKDPARGEYPTEFTYEKFEFKNPARSWWKPGGFSPKWYLTAFPPNEVNKGYGLVQNPGW